jgi:hypothetical protein
LARPSNHHEFLDEIGENPANPAVEVNAICVKSPSVPFRNPIEAPVKNEMPESILVHLQDSDVSESVAGRGMNCVAEPFVERDVHGALFPRHQMDDSAVLAHKFVEPHLKRILRVRVLTHVVVGAFPGSDALPRWAESRKRFA